MQWSIKRKGQLNSREIFIDATLDPSCSLSFTFFDGKNILYVKHRQRYMTRHFSSVRSQCLTSITHHTTTCFACARVYVGCETVPMNVLYLHMYKVIVVERQKCDIYDIPNIPFRLKNWKRYLLMACFCVYCLSTCFGVTSTASCSDACTAII